MRKTMSPAQLTANRRNAQKSTGPKTEKGRAVSKLNALKHGILSKEVVVRGRQIKEDESEFAALHLRFWEDWNPVGATEEMLVGEIVTTHWRLRRALKAESGEIALSVDGGQWKRSRDNAKLQWNPLATWRDPVSKLEDSSLGNSFLADWLCDVRARVELEGELTEAAIKMLFHGQPNTLSMGLAKLRMRLLQNPDGTDAASRREENKKQALAYIDRELGRLESRKADCEKREAAEEETRQAAAVLPSLAVLDKIMRYETKLERQMYRAMNQLERLQRMRQGEAVPPPLTMEVSERS